MDSWSLSGNAPGRKVAKLEQEAQRQKQAPSAQSHLARRAVRGGGGSHQAQEVRVVVHESCSSRLVQLMR